MFSESKKLEQLNKILESQEFKDSKSYKNLLKYLVEASIKNENPTESSIAIDGLGKNDDFDQSTDASVRVYIHNLRKKLASYYLNEGKSDTIKISIPKGQHYQIQYTPLMSKNRKKIFWLINSSILLLLLLFNIIYLKGVSEHSINPESLLDKSVVWRDLASSSLPVVLVFGDFFIYKVVTDDLPKYVRDFRINSPEDLSEFKDTLSEDRSITETELTFLGKSSIDSFPGIYDLLKTSGKDISIKLSSQITWDDLATNDIIFIGSFKTLRLFSDLIKDINSSYRIHPNTIFYKDESADSIYEYHAPKDTETGFVKDYALVAKIPGPNKNTIMIFAGTHDIGQSATVNSFISSDYLGQFEEDYSSEPEEYGFYFEAILEVKGFERTGFYPNLVHFNRIPDDFKIESID
ncbi:MAG: hypothetical protein JW995_12845 [Melioribacteraceae bacterium]|nr:hypothetical protein [Melioribacteraceae bacterium]